MCEPEKPHASREPLRSAVSEIISAMSALNMRPHPIPPHEQEPENNGYLSQTDYWAEHAVEHMRAAIECLRIAENRQQYRSVALLVELLNTGKLAELDVLAVLYDIQEDRTPGELRRLHHEMVKFRHEMEGGDAG
jgi:hypothetical protein